MSGRHSADRGRDRTPDRKPDRSDDELGRLLSSAFDARADASVGEHAVPPRPRYADAAADHAVTGPIADPFAGSGVRSAGDFADVTPLRRSRAKLWAPLAAAAAVVAIVAGAFAISGGGDGKPDPVAGPTSSSVATPSSTSAPASSVPAANAVKITTLNSDGVTYGVGMPVIVYFSKKITDAKAWQANTKTTANGKPLQTAWYFQPSNAGHGPIEAQLRPKDYWPAHSKIRVQFPAAGTSLGRGFASDGKLGSLEFEIGARHIVTVNNATHELTVQSDGKTTDTYPVSLGASNTRTQRGIKVIMEKGRDISMRGPGYYDPHIKDTQRLTFGGEYLHAAPWNVSNIDHGVNSSNGCTNLKPGDAAALYGELHVGDVVTYPNANGPQMQMGQGYGLWNVGWGEYQTGGLVPTR